MILISNRPLRRAAGGLVATILAALILPGVLLAHAELVTATPADKSTVTAPVTEISGIYSEAMTPTGSSIVVKNASGATVASGTVDPANDLRMSAIPAKPLGNGTYSVGWTSNSTDGHLLRGKWTFAVAVAAVPSSTPAVTPVASTASDAPTPAPTPLVATPAASTGPTPVPSNDGTTAGNGSDVVLPIIVALIVLGAGAVFLLMRRNRPTDQT